VSRILVTISVACLLAAPALAQEAKPAKKTGQEAGQQAEKKKPKLVLGQRMNFPVSLADLDGKVHSAENYLGKIVVVNFWSIQCPIMKGWEPRLKAIHEKYSEQGVVFLMVNSNEGNREIAQKTATEDRKAYQNIRDYLKKRELPYTVLIDHDSKVANLFEAKTTPDIYVFDKRGRFVFRGLIDDDPRGSKGEKAKHYLIDLLDDLLVGEEVEPLATTPIGCSIKRPRTERGDG
jgi:thiol-disulfide isomerase/thioredoxin